MVGEKLTLTNRSASNDSDLALFRVGRCHYTNDMQLSVYWDGIGSVGDS